MSDLIDAHLAHCRAAGYSRITIQDRGELLRRIDGALPWGLCEATTEELADWLAGPDTPWSNQTKATYYTHVTGFYRWACSPTVADGLDYDPSAGLSRPRVPRGVPKPVGDDQLRVILEIGEPFRLWALLAALAGLRAAEIAGLSREDVSEDSITVHGKGGKDRVVPTHPTIWALAQDLPPGPLARKVKSGRVADGAYISRAMRKQIARCITGRHCGVHRLRHWFGTTTYRTTHNLRVVQELMGHESANTTAGYTLVTSEERRAAIQALPTLANLL